MQRTRISTGMTALAAALLLGTAAPAPATFAGDKPVATVATSSKTKGNKFPSAAETEPEVAFSVSIPQVDAVNSTLTTDELKAILTGNLEAYADQLAALEADSVTVPTISIIANHSNGSDTNQATVTITNLVLEDVSGGVAAKISLASIEMEAVDARASFGSMSADNFSIAGLLSFYGLIERPEQTGMETIYANFSAEGGTVDADDMSCVIGGTSAAEFRARPLRISFIEMIALAEAMENNPDDIEPGRIAEFMRMYADIFTAVESSDVFFDGMNCEGTDSTGNSVAIAIEGITMSGMAPGIYPAISFDGLTIDAGDEGYATLENFTIKQMDLAGAIEALSNLPDDVSEAWFDDNWRSFVPGMEGLSLSGLDMNVPNPDDEHSRIQVGIGLFDLTLGGYRNGIPVQIEMVASNLRAELPDDLEDEQLQQLRALGLTSVDLGFRIAASWDEERNAIDFEELSMDAADLASLVIAGSLTNAPPELFDGDPETALNAALSMALKAMDISVTDAGFSDIVFSLVAAEQNTSPASLRLITAALAEGMLIAQLAELADARTIAAAVNEFIAGEAKTLNIAVEAKNDPGLNAQDLMEAEENPATLIEKVNISVEAR